MSSGGGDVSTSARMPKWVKKDQRGFFKQAQDVLGESYIGPEGLVAGANQDMLSGWDAARQAAGAQQGTVGQLQGAFGDLVNFGSGNDALLQRRLSDIANLSNRNLSENVLPALRTNAVQAGQTGSSRQGIAEGLAARGALEQTARSQDELLANAENMRLNALGQASNAGSNLLQQQLAPANTLGALGAQQRGLQTEQMREGLLRQQAELERLQGLGNINAQVINPQMGTNQRQDSESWKTGDWVQAGIGAGMSMFSDAALKYDIEDIEGSFGGVPAKKWKWRDCAKVLGYEGTGVGVLAQDVEKLRPDCVIYDFKGSGYMGVNYGKLIMEAK